MFFKEINTLVLCMGITSLMAFQVDASDVFSEEEFQEFLRLIAEAGPQDMEEASQCLGKRSLGSIISGLEPPQKKPFTKADTEVLNFDLPQLNLYNILEPENIENNFNLLNILDLPKPSALKGLTKEEIRGGNIAILELSPNLKTVPTQSGVSNVYGHRLQGAIPTEGSVPKMYVVDIAEILKSKHASMTEQNIFEYFLIVESALRQAILENPQILHLNVYVGETSNAAKRKNEHVHDIRHAQDRKSCRSREYIKNHGALIMNSFVHNVESQWSKAFETLVAKVIKTFKRDTTNAEVGNAKAHNLVNTYWETPERISNLSQKGLIKMRTPRPVKLLKVKNKPVASAPKAPKIEPDFVAVKEEATNTSCRSMPLFPRFE